MYSDVQAQARIKKALEAISFWGFFMLKFLPYLFLLIETEVSFCPRCLPPQKLFYLKVMVLSYTSALPLMLLSTGDI